MTVIEASKRIGISPAKLYQLLAARKLAHYRVDGKIIIQENDISAFLAGCRIPAVPSEPPFQMPRLKLKHITLHGGA